MAKDSGAIGALGIRVLPLTKGFGGKTRTALKNDQLLKRLEVKVPVVIDKVIDKVNFTALKRKLEAQLTLEAKITGVDNKALKDVKKQAEYLNNILKAKSKLVAIDDSEINKVRSLGAELKRLTDKNKTVLTIFDREDIKKWRADLEKAVSNVRVKLDFAGDDRGFKRKLDEHVRHFENLAQSINSHNLIDMPDEHVHAVMRKLERIKDKVENLAEDRTIRLDFNPFTAWAKGRIDWLTRPRIVELIPKVSEAAAAKAATAIAALTGARLGWHYLDKFKEWFSDIDKRLPRIAAGFGLLTSAVSGLLATTAGVAGLGQSLAYMTPTLLLLPGMFANAALSATTFVVAARDAKDELSELSDGFTKLRDDISSGFWDKARQPLLDMFNSIMPQLQKSFNQAAAAQGAFVAVMAKSFQKQLAGGRLEAMFAGMTGFWKELTRGAGEFARAVVNLGLVASKYMPRLGKWLADLSIKFDGWLADVAADGRLYAWIERGIDQFKYMGRSIKALGGIFAGVWAAAESAGYRGVYGMMKHLETWEKHVRGAKWQETMTAMFAGSKRAMSSFGDAFKALGNSLHVMRNDISRALAGTAASVSKLLSSLFKGMQQSEFRNGFRALTDGVGSALRSLAEAMPAFTRIFGQVMQTVGRLAAALAPTIAAALNAIQPLLVPVLESVSRLAEMLAPVLAAAFNALTPVAGAAGVALTAFSAVFAGSMLATKVSAVGSALKLLVPSLLALRGGAGAARAALGEAAAAAAAAGSGIGKAGAGMTLFSRAINAVKFALGPVGLIIAGISLAMAAFSAYAKRNSVDSDKLSDAISRGANAWQLYKEKAEDSIWNTSELKQKFNDVGKELTLLEQQTTKAGSSMRGLTTGGVTASQEVINKVGEMGDALADVANTDLAAAQKSFAAFAREQKLSTENVKTAISQSDAYSDALKGIAESVGLSTDKTTLAKIATGEISAKMIDARKAAMEYEQEVRDNASSLESLNGVSYRVSDAVSKLADQFTNYGSRMRASRDAQFAFLDALDEAPAKIAANMQALNGMAGAFDTSHRAGRDNVRVLQELSARALEAAGAEINAGNGAQTASEKFKQHMASVLDLADSFGMSRQELEQFLQKQGMMPKNIDVWLRDNFPEVTSKAQTAKNAVQEIPPYSLIKVDAKTDNFVEKMSGVKTQTDKFVSSDPTAMVKANVTEADQALNNISSREIDINLSAQKALSELSQLKNAINGVKGKTVTVKASVGSGMASILALKATVAALRDRTLNMRVNNGAGLNAVTALRNAIAGLRDRTVNARVNNGAGLNSVAALRNALASLRDRTVNARVNVGSGVNAVNQLRNTINSLRGKTVGVGVSGVWGAINSVNALTKSLWGIPNRTVTVRVVKRSEGGTVPGFASGGTVPGFASGGTIPGFASGGTIRGFNGGVRNGTVYGGGTAKSDSIVVRLSRGEEVIQQPYAGMFRDQLKMLNKGIIPQFNSGGTVGGSGSAGFSANQPVVLRVYGADEVLLGELDARVEQAAAGVSSQALFSRLGV